MFYSVLLVVAIAVGLYLQKKSKRLSKAEQRQLFRKFALWGGVGLIVLLALTGRAHWLMGVIAGLIGIASRAVQLAAFFPVFKKLFSLSENQENASQQNQGTTKVDANEMTRFDAAGLLGVDLHASTEEIKQAHRKLMQKVHPDRGGTDALAAQLNRAKDVLLSGL